MKLKLQILLILSCCSLALRAQSPPTDGQVLWLKADAGVTADENGVSGWTDQSPNGNNAGPLSSDFGATGTEAPALIPDAYNHLPAIRFDGADDVLEIPTSPSLQPMDGSWTVIFVGRRVGRGAGDFPQVIGSRPWLAGLDKGWAVSIDAEGLVASHYADDAAGHDVPAVRSTTALGDSLEIWQVEEDRTGGKTTFYKRADADKSTATAMPVSPIDQFNPIHIGREVGGANNRRANIDLAEVLVYNRVLSKQERLAVTKYLSDRYGLSFTANVPPTVSLTSPPNGASVAAPGVIKLEATATDPDGSIARVEFYNDSGLLGTVTAAPFLMNLKVLVPGTLHISAVAVDNRGERTESPAVTVTASGTAPDLTFKTGLQLWLKADAGVSSNEGFAWADQSDNQNNASQLDPEATPVVVTDPASGKPAVQFDGVDDYLEIANAPSLQPGSGNWSVFFVGKRLSSSQGDFPQVIGSRPWVAGLDKGWSVSYDSGGTVASHYADGAVGHDVPQTLAASALSTSEYQAWEVEENRDTGFTSFYLNGGLNQSLNRVMPSGPIDQTDNIYIGREIGGANNRRANMELGEVLVYNRVLSASERESVTAYLAGKYALPGFSVQNTLPTVAITAPADQASLTFGTEFTLSANAADTDGSIVRVDFYAGTRLLGSSTQAPYSIKVSDLGAGPQILTARAVDNVGGFSVSAPIAVTNVVLNPPKPMTLIGAVDYSDTFTVGPAGDPSEENKRPNGMYNNNTFNGYDVENSHGNPTATWTPTANFSFNTPGNSTGPQITQNAQGNAGAATGFAQSGGGDFNFAYGLRNNYVVQVDAILPLDRLDVGTYANAGDDIFAANSLTVFFRKDSSALPGFGIFNGSKETGVVNDAGNLVRTGVDDQNWHQFGVHFDQANSRLGLFVDGIQKASLDLKTFADGIYANFANGAVGTGGAGYNGTQAQWMDNFMVGAPALVGIADYSDTFTVTAPPRRDGLYNDNSGGAYSVESTHGNPAATWAPTANFSFNTPGSSTAPAITQAATGNSGADTGFAQSGGGDFSLPYGLRDEYTVSVDAILPLDRLDISSLPSAGANIFAAPSLSVFFRKDSLAGNLPGIGLFNGSKETALLSPAGEPAKTGVDDANWHNFAVQFNKTAGRIAVFVDGQLKGTADLAEFEGGIYNGFANGAVGVGGAGYAGGQAQWFDNFSVGAPGPGAAVFETTNTNIGPITITRQGGQIQLTWTTAGKLEVSNNVNGPYTEVAGATSGIKLDLDGDHKFFRLSN